MCTVWKFNISVRCLTIKGTLQSILTCLYKIIYEVHGTEKPILCKTGAEGS